ncbi:DUF2937 domain-containing protein [Photobacterium sanctipauli]|uniref:DUF2937 domain-containing protein n=1 Tax=Photobacterium sanctipauli TaxID=1342794 RepID=A0A2T3NYB3_9GAMM|nr:DUF2937 family protein [Photobacterium sanctipauli]PSW21189.1 DUF2937 domain-containing protein [Photobacterium sanctipauli]
MIKRIIDRLIFGGLLVATLQIPMLADHYLQYLSGFYDATSQQVNAYRINARQHGYSSAESMINALLQESNAVVRFDAKQKLEILNQHQGLEQAIDTLSTGHLLDKALFMFNPARFDELQRVLAHYTPGIPIDIESIAICIAMALGLNATLYLPLMLFRRQPKNSAQTTASQS